MPTPMCLQFGHVLSAVKQCHTQGECVKCLSECVRGVSQQCARFVGMIMVYFAPHFHAPHEHTEHS
eukprot:13632941-Alexandrium_andersonii.AAC.1